MSDIEQWEAATRVLLGIVRLQAETPGAISLSDLPDVVQLAARERDRQGDYGAARMLREWSEQLELPVAEWDD